MKIVVNGESKEIIEGFTITKFLEELKVNPQVIVVELNLDIIDRGEYDKIYLKEGDKLEVIRFVGGG